MATPKQPGRAKRTDSPRERLMALPSTRRAQLLDPAEDEFAAFGFTNASLNRILTAADMSKGQAYYYIEDKADLYSAVIERALERLVSSIVPPSTDPQSAGEFWDQVRDYLAQVSMVLKRDERLATLARGIYEGAQSRAALTGPLAEIRRLVDRLIRLGQTVNAVRTDLPQSLLANILFAAAREIDRWFAMHWDELAPQDALQLNAKAVAMLRAIAAPQDHYEGRPNVDGDGNRKQSE